MFNKFRKSAEEVELNLMPVMNLLMVLIPLLLAGASFFKIAVIPVSTPTHTPGESDVPKTPTTVSCNLAIGKDDMQLTVSSTSLSEEELEALGATFPLKGGKHDGEALRKKLVELKEAYPKSTTIVVVPNDTLKYQELVDVLDFIREYPKGTDPKSGEPAMKELFPVTVFSRFIPPPPEGEEIDEGEEEGGEEE